MPYSGSRWGIQDTSHAALWFCCLLRPPVDVMTCNTRHCVTQAIGTQTHGRQGRVHSPFCSDNSPKRSCLFLPSWEEAKILLLTLQPSAGHQPQICSLHPHRPLHQQPPQTGETGDAGSTALPTSPAPCAANIRFQTPRLPQGTTSISQHIPQPFLCLSAEHPLFKGPDLKETLLPTPTLLGQPQSKGL